MSDLKVTDHAMDGGLTVIAVEGDFDVYQSPAVREKIIDLDNAGKRDLIVDLSQVTFMDSTGIGVLVGGLKRVGASGGDIDLVYPDGHIVQALFRVTGLVKVFWIFESVGEAMRNRQSTDRGSGIGRGQFVETGRLPGE